MIMRVKNKYKDLKEVIELEGGEQVLVFGAKDREEAYSMYKEYMFSEHGFGEDEISNIEDFDHREVRIKYSSDYEEMDLFNWGRAETFCKKCGQKRIWDEFVWVYFLNI